jgi:hypothetical protein
MEGWKNGTTVQLSPNGGVEGWAVDDGGKETGQIFVFRYSN